MITGGAIGLLFGPAGVIIGGLVGGFIGNQVEYENRRMERERRQTYPHQSSLVF